MLKVRSETGIRSHTCVASISQSSLWLRLTTVMLTVISEELQAYRTCICLDDDDLSL